MALLQKHKAMETWAIGTIPVSQLQGCPLPQTQKGNVKADEVAGQRYRRHHVNILECGWTLKLVLFSWERRLVCLRPCGG